MAGRKLFFADMMVLVLASRSLMIVVAQDDPQTSQVGIGCSDAVTYRYMNEGVFNDNLDTALASLAKNISSSNASSFATAVSNKNDTDPVYALLLCRKYLTSKACLECFKAAETGLKESCSNKGSNGGRILLDGCLLHYENATFFQKGTDDGSSKYCASVNDSKPLEFTKTAETLLSQLTANASTSDGNAVGKASDGSTHVYGVAQCVPTLSSDTCQACLEGAQTLIKNCLPMQEGRGLQAGCFMRYSPYSFYDDNSTSSNITPNSPTTSSNSHVKTWPIVLGSIGGAALLAALCSVFICRRRLKGVYFRRRHSYTRSEEELVGAVTFEQVVFDYHVLRDATENFNNTNLVGRGGYGEVYKGRLVDGRTIAVKKLSERGSSEAMEDFLTEVKLISSVRHRNLVRLLGCCARGHERLLVYEFMSNKSLDKHLFGPTGPTRIHLDWETRFDIIVGTARGLSYLHEESNIRIVHRDIKAANILLDHKFHPKIADFGLAKFFPEGESYFSTRVGGTIGYTAPEYAVHGQLSEKADVYSYGVLVLEIVSGRKCVNQRLPGPLQLLLEWAWRQYQSEQALEIVDEGLRESEYPREQVLRVINIALLCCQASSAVRPTMSGVVSMLTTASEIDVRPTQPAFIDTGVSTSRPSSSASASTSASEPAQSHGSISLSFFPR